MGKQTTVLLFVGEGRCANLGNAQPFADTQNVAPGR